jgi:hypothetical protein
MTKMLGRLRSLMSRRRGLSRELGRLASRRQRPNRTHGKTRYRCTNCGRVGVYGSMTSDSFSRVKIPAWIIRKIGRRGSAMCLNVRACEIRRVLPRHRRRTSRQTAAFA